MKQARETVVRAARAAKGPALTAGAAAVAFAGGTALMKRRQPKRVLGVKMPRSMPKARVPSIDGESLVKQVGKTRKQVGKTGKQVGKTRKRIGKASKQIGETSKNVGNDLHRIGEQAERIGKVLD